MSVNLHLNFGKILFSGSVIFSWIVKHCWHFLNMSNLSSASPVLLVGAPFWSPPSYSISVYLLECFKMLAFFPLDRDDTDLRWLFYCLYQVPPRLGCELIPCHLVITFPEVFQAITISWGFSSFLFSLSATWDQLSAIAWLSSQLCHWW